MITDHQGVFRPDIELAAGMVNSTGSDFSEGYSKECAQEEKKRSSLWWAKADRGQPCGCSLA
jgi:hypothetical protein